MESTPVLLSFSLWCFDLFIFASYIQFSFIDGVMFLLLILKVCDDQHSKLIPYLDSNHFDGLVVNLWDGKCRWLPFELAFGSTNLGLILEILVLYRSSFLWTMEFIFDSKPIGT